MCSLIIHVFPGGVSLAWPDLQWQISAGCGCWHGIQQISLFVGNSDKTSGHSTSPVHQTALHALVIHVHWGNWYNVLTYTHLSFAFIEVNETMYWGQVISLILCKPLLTIVDIGTVCGSSYHVNEAQLSTRKTFLLFFTEPLNSAIPIWMAGQQKWSSLCSTQDMGAFFYLFYILPSSWCCYCDFDIVSFCITTIVLLVIYLPCIKRQWEAGSHCPVCHRVKNWQFSIMTYWMNLGCYNKILICC